MHYTKRIKEGGAVYDFDNMLVNTVKNHVKSHSNTKQENGMEFKNNLDDYS
ncbi:hypothetical protein [Erwinia billingiae]|uniref:hypothetical protein n=1 Tax=Erwinia billingiae TaxID=182337 RepID=UPI00309CDB85